MVTSKISYVAPSPSGRLVAPHTLQNGILRDRFLTALFGRSEQVGYLSHLGSSAGDLQLAIKMKSSLFSLVESFDPDQSRVDSVLRMAAEALRIEIFQSSWTEDRLFPQAENTLNMESFSWKTKSVSIPDFLKDCGALLVRLEKPLFGGLPKLAAELIEVAKLPSPDKQIAERTSFLTSLDPAKTMESIQGLLAILGNPHFMPLQRIEEIINKFHKLSPIKKLANKEQAILEARAYVMGMVIRATKSVTAFRENWFTYLGFGRYHTDEIKDLMIKMGFEREWHSFDLEFQEAHRPTA